MTLSIGTHTSNLTESSLSRSITAGSAMLYGFLDFLATNPPGKTPLAGSGTATERLDQGDGTHYGQYICDWTDVLTGTFSLGPNNYTTEKVAQAIIEILSSSGTASILQWAQVANWFTTGNNGATKTITGLAWNANDVIVVFGGAEAGLNGSNQSIAPSNANLTFGAAVETQGVGNASECSMQLYACLAASTQSAQTITITFTGNSAAFGGAVWVIREVPYPARDRVQVRPSQAVQRAANWRQRLIRPTPLWLPANARERLLLPAA